MTLHESTETATAGRRRRFSPTDLALVASFAALISALAYLGAVPVGGAGVPITLQTLGVMLAGCLLGPVRGAAAVLLYLLLGFIGLPVFAEHSSGLGVLGGTSVGYLLSFPVAALVGGFLVTRIPASSRTRAVPIFLCSIAASILVIHPMGIGALVLRHDLTFDQALHADMPFWVGDLLKTAIVALVASEVHRAFPRLLDRR